LLRPAIANAKEALEETLTPHLKDMLAAKLQEMEDSSVEEEVVNESAEEVEEAKHDKKDEGKKSDDDAMEEGSKEDDMDEVVEEELTEVPAAMEEAEDDSEESEDEAEAEDHSHEEEEAVEGDEDLGDLSVDQFKDMIRDIIAQELGHEGGEEELGADMDAGDIEGMGDEESIEEPELDAASDEEEIDLDELLRELESVSEMSHDKEKVSELDGGTDDVYGDGDVIVNISKLSPGMKAVWEIEKEISEFGDSQDAQAFVDDMTQITSEEELVSYLEGRDIDTRTIVHMVKAYNRASVEEIEEGKHKEEEMEEEKKKHNKMEKELKEALDTIETLRNDLQEVNLLNSKLLYVNKIFKANNLTESQKVNVIAAFDKAETVKEVKLVFETVSENVAAPKKENVTEAKLGMASKATGTTASKPEVITEANAAVTRMQILAGIKPRQF